MISRAKNILIVAHYYPPHIGGIEMIAFNQAKKLAASGQKVTVVTSAIGSKQKEEMNDGVRVLRVTAWNFFERWGIPFPIFSPWILPILIREAKKSDVVHIHDAFYKSSFLAAFAGRWYEKPIVLTQHVAFVRYPNWIVTTIEKVLYATTGALIFRWSSVIFTYNKNVEQFLLSRNIDKKKLLVLPNGVDTNFFHPVSLEEKVVLRSELGLDLAKKIILFVGRFVPKKGLDKVLLVGSEAYQVVCAGGDAPKEAPKNITFLGKLDQKTLLKAYQAADIFLLPSESEGFPLSVQEAMASGLAIITTNDPGYQAYNFNKNLICLIDVSTEAALRNNIQNIISDPERLSAMSEYSRKYAEKHFDWSVNISQLEKTYDDILTLAKKKKIAFISDSIYPFNKGGKEKRLYDITTRLAAQGHEVTIYCMQWWKGEKVIVKDGVTLYAISPYYPLYAGPRRSMKEAIFFALHSFKLLDKKFDVIDVDHMPYMILFTMKIVCILKGKKMIATWHEVVGLEYWNQYIGSAGIIAYWIEKMSVMLPNKIVSVSEHTTRKLKNDLGVKKEIITIPNGLDVVGIERKLPAATGFDLVFAGRLLAHKNIDMLLRALDILAKKNIHPSSLIIGEGPERQNLEELSKKLGLERTVSFKNFLENHDDLYAIMHASRVFMLPSTREGFGIAVLEANACGLPVVTIDDEKNAGRELITNGENGFLCKLEPAELAGAIEKALMMKKDRESYYQYAEKYDWSHLLPEIEKIYNA